ncbi:hypothetical protein [Arthrobacter sp. GAS37]|uniref:hypothetical protein n=1 Tax=Arthrobacter sp. GAS37 TaxID=3156261 RepID=UPI00384AD602
MSEGLGAFEPAGEPDTSTAADAADSAAILRGQAQSIIDEVLNSTEPEYEQARAQLRRIVARYPGHPELALLVHLMNREQ